MLTGGSCGIGLVQGFLINHASKGGGGGREGEGGGGREGEGGGGREWRDQREVVVFLQSAALVVELGVSRRRRRRLRPSAAADWLHTLPLCRVDPHVATREHARVELDEHYYYPVAC